MHVLGKNLQFGLKFANSYKWNYVWFSSQLRNVFVLYTSSKTVNFDIQTFFFPFFLIKIWQLYLNNVTWTWNSMLFIVLREFSYFMYEIKLIFNAIEFWTFHHVEHVHSNIISLFTIITKYIPSNNFFKNLS